jgi:hypothetical protein
VIALLLFFVAWIIMIVQAQLEADREWQEQMQRLGQQQKEQLAADKGWSRLPALIEKWIRHWERIDRDSGGCLDG